MAKRKGPKWGDIYSGANNIEAREVEAVTRPRSLMGRSYVDMLCPFCRLSVRAYLWSLAGSGKRCNCGALTGSSGVFYHFADREQ